MVKCDVCESEICGKVYFAPEGVNLCGVCSVGGSNIHELPESEARGIGLKFI
jgi:hypothetical protein